MPVAERSPKLLRGQKAICIPCSQQQYEQVFDDPEQFRRLLDHQIEATPELFPPEIRRGYRMKNIYTSRKTGWKLRRIELRDLRCYLVRPSFLMPYLSGHTEDVQAPLVWFFRDFSCHSMEVDRGGRPSPLRSTKAVEKHGPPPDPRPVSSPNSHTASQAE